MGTIQIESDSGNGIKAKRKRGKGGRRKLAAFTHCFFGTTILLTVVIFNRCVIVIVDVRQNKQTHLTNTSKKTIVSLSFCGDGKHIASGEVSLTTTTTTTNYRRKQSEVP